MCDMFKEKIVALKNFPENDGFSILPNLAFRF